VNVRAVDAMFEHRGCRARWPSPLARRAPAARANGIGGAATPPVAAQAQAQGVAPAGQACEASLVRLGNHLTVGLRFQWLIQDSEWFFSCSPKTGARPAG